jgi:hypothetical protein
VEVKRGIIFTLDALVAVALAVLALIIITQLLSLRTGEWYREISLYESAQDFITSRDKDGTLKSVFNQTDSAANAILTSLISSELPQNLVVQINITICKYEGGFVCYRNLTIGQSGNTSTKSVVRRIFTNTENNSYGVAVMEVWYK